MNILYNYKLLQKSIKYFLIKYFNFKFKKPKIKKFKIFAQTNTILLSVIINWNYYLETLSLYICRQRKGHEFFLYRKIPQWKGKFAECYRVYYRRQEIVGSSEFPQEKRFVRNTMWWVAQTYSWDRVSTTCKFVTLNVTRWNFMTLRKFPQTIS